MAFSFVASVNAADKIEGAFGLRLGDRFEPTTHAKSILHLGEGFEFSPKKPNSAFSDYLVFVTPQSHLIYQIAAVHHEKHEDSKPPADHTSQSQKCHDVVEKVKAIVRQKYQNGGDGNSRILDGNREIRFTETECDANGCEVAVVYLDEALARQAGQEEFSGKQKKLLEGADPTGL